MPVTDVRHDTETLTLTITAEFAAPVQRVVSRLVEPRLVRNTLSGTYLGHPMHPVLTDIPIGSWVAATVLDLVGGPRQAAAEHTPTSRSRPGSTSARAAGSGGSGIPTAASTTGETGSSTARSDCWGITPW